MKLYLTIIGICSLLISAVIYLVTEVDFFIVLGWTVLAVVIEILIDSLIATLARLLPKKWARHDAKVFTVSAKEKKFYEKLKIRKWKDSVPEIGHFTGFRKNKIVDPKSVEYLDRFLLEACYGEIGHFFILFFGFAVLLLYPISKVWIAISIPVAIVNIFLNLPSLFILRYNSYKLEILRKNLIKKSGEKEKTSKNV
ncbi:MAG: hypothetical protein IJX87_06825 [Clostridia bacterium]|nr:hypothetical protein [Clostridia bacterium]